MYIQWTGIATASATYRPKRAAFFLSNGVIVYVVSLITEFEFPELAVVEKKNLLVCKLVYFYASH